MPICRSNIMNGNKIRYISDKKDIPSGTNQDITNPLGPAYNKEVSSGAIIESNEILNKDIAKFISSLGKFEDIRYIDIRVILDEDITKSVKIQQKQPSGKIKNIHIDEDITKIVKSQNEESEKQGSNYSLFIFGMLILCAMC